MSAGTYAIKWKGMDLGEMSVAQIRRQLADGNISRMHQVHTDEGWMSVDDFIRRVDGSEAQERQLRQEQRRVEFRPQAGLGPVLDGTEPEAVTALPLQPSQTVAPAYTAPYHEATRDAAASTKISGFFLGLFRGDKSTVWVSVWMAAAAGLPLMILPLVDSFKLGTDWVIWLLEGYFSLLIAGYVYRLSGSQPGLLRRGLGFFMFTIAVGIPILLQAQTKWPILKEIYAGTLKEGLGNGLMGYVAGVGLCEEICKALPLLIFCFGRGPVKTRDVVFLGMMSGLGFAFSEGAVYTFSSAAETVTINMGSILETLRHVTNEKQFVAQLQKLRPDLVKLNLYGLVVHLVRFVSLPLLHGAWAGCVGWFVARASALKSWQSLAFGIVFVAILHGMYDVLTAGLMGPGLASNILSLTIVVFSILLFASHLREQPAPQALPGGPLPNLNSIPHG